MPIETLSLEGTASMTHEETTSSFTEKKKKNRDVTRTTESEFLARGQGHFNNMNGGIAGILD